MADRGGTRADMTRACLAERPKIQTAKRNKWAPTRRLSPSQKEGYGPYYTVARHGVQLYFYHEQRRTKVYDVLHHISF